MTPSHALTVLLEDRLITFNRAVGLLRRRNLPVHSIAVGPTADPGVSRLTIMVNSDDDTARRAAQQLEKVVGVRQAGAFAVSDAVTREMALVRIRAHGDRYAELLDVVQLYHATIVDDTADTVMVELTGSEAFVLSGIRALERFEIVELARSGTMAMEVTGHASRVPSTVT